MLFHLAELEEIIETVFWTATIADAVPVSLILVGPSGSAKSALIKQYSSPAFHVTDSFTSQGLFDIVQRDPKSDIRFLLVPDINPSLSRKPFVVQSAVSNLLTLTFDGSVRIDDGRQTKECKHAPIGFISAVTPEMYQGQAKRWMWLGLRRRIIPLFFTYSNSTISTLQKLVAHGKIRSVNGFTKKLKLPAPSKAPMIQDAEATDLMVESERFAQLLGKISIHDQQNRKQWISTKLVPVSPQVTLRTLAEAHARKSGRNRVIHKDMDFVRTFVNYVDPEVPRML
jgi:hypothetical protein